MGDEREGAEMKPLFPAGQEPEKRSSSREPKSGFRPRRSGATSWGRTSHKGRYRGYALSSSVVVISVVSEEQPWQVDGQRRTTDDGALMLAHGELVAIQASELQRGFEDYQALYGDDVKEDDIGAVVFAGDDGYLDPDEGVEPISFAQHQGRVCINLQHYIAWPEEDDYILRIEATLRRTIDPFLDTRGAKIVDVNIDDYGPYLPTNFVGLSMRVLPPTISATLQDVYDLGKAVLRLVTAFVEQAPTRDTLADLIRGGNAPLLIGQPEGNWLDVKKAEYMLDAPKGRFSLAVEVAAFCNAEEGGVLVFGAATETVGGGEVISAVDGLDRLRGNTRQYLAVLNSWVYPFPFGLRVDEVNLPTGRSLLMVDIPAQPEELKPFLVSGALKPNEAAKVDRESITVAQRRGEDTVRLNAPMLHAQLAAGRAYLRGRLPRND